MIVKDFADSSRQGLWHWSHLSVYHAVVAACNQFEFCLNRTCTDGSLLFERRQNRG